MKINNYTKNLSKYNFDNYLTVIFLIFGIIFSLILFFVNVKILPASLTVSLFAVLYLVIKQKSYQQFRIENLSNISFNKLYSLVFFIIFLSILSIILREDTYVRPIIFFVLISIALGVLSYIILYRAFDRKKELLILFAILFIGLILRLTPIILFPKLVGADPWVHMDFVNLIISSGQIGESTFPYAKLPGMHILIASTALICNLDYKWASFVAVALPQLVTLIVIYLISRSILNIKVGLLAALLLCISPNYISLGYWIHPTTLAIIFSIFLLFLVFRGQINGELSSNSVIKLIFAFMVVITHMMIPLSIFIATCVIWVGKNIYQLFSEKIQKKSTMTIFVAFFFVVMFSWWIYVTGTVLPENILRLVLTNNPDRVAAVGVSVSTNYSDYLIRVSPYLIFYGLFIFGFLFSFSKKSNINLFTLSIAACSVLAVPFLLMGTDFGGMMMERWVYVSQVLIVPVAALAIIIIYNTINRKFIQYFMTGLLICFIFLNVTNYSSNMDNNFLSNSTIVYGHTTSEIEAISTLSPNFSGIYVSDNVYGLLLPKNRFMPTDLFIGKNKSLNSSSLILIRSSLGTSIPGKRPNLDPTTSLSDNTIFNRIYDNYQVVGFINNYKIKYQLP